MHGWRDITIPLFVYAHTPSEARETLLYHIRILESPYLCLAVNSLPRQYQNNTITHRCSIIKTQGLGGGTELLRWEASGFLDAHLYRTFINSSAISMIACALYVR